MFFFFKQKTAYEMRISDWSSDVCSSDLMKPTISRAIAVVTIALALPVVAVDVPSGLSGDGAAPLGGLAFRAATTVTFFRKKPAHQIGRASCRERVCQYV